MAYPQEKIGAEAGRGQDPSLPFLSKWRVREVVERRSKLHRAGYFASVEFARVAEMWWQLRNGPLILEGDPGCGKTSFALAMAACEDVSFHRVDCYTGIGVEQLLYSWNKQLQDAALALAQVEAGGKRPPNVKGVLYDLENMVPGVMMEALLDPHPHVLVLVNELDKIPKNERTESLLLQVFDEFNITVSEQQKVFKPAAGVAPHIIITSNAGGKQSGDASGGNEILSHPTLRRGPRFKLPTPDRVRQYQVLCAKAPTLPLEVIRSCVLYAERTKTRVMEKPVALSEVIMWAQGLEWLGVDVLTADAVHATLHYLTKTDYDYASLDKQLRQDFKQLDKSTWDPEPEVEAAEKAEEEIERQMMEAAAEMQEA